MGLLDQTASVIMRDQFSGVFDRLHRMQQQAGQGFEKMGQASSGAGNMLSGLGGIASSLGITLGVAGAVGAAKAALELGNLGAQSLVTRQSFESVTASVGKSAALLDEMKAAAGGTVDEMRLMQLANTALAGASGETGAAFADLIPKLIEGARAANKLNPALGDTEFLFQSLVTGIKRGSPLLIDNTGITLSIADANQRMADSLGKSVDALSEQEKQLALMQETARGVDRIMAQAGGSLDTMATSADKLKVSFQELKVAIGEALAPAASTLQTTLANQLNVITASIGGDELAQAQAQLALVNGEIARYTELTTINAGAEEARIRTLEGLNKQQAELTATIIKLKSASESGVMTKQEQEARRLVGVTTDATFYMTKQEQEARRLAGATDQAGDSMAIMGAKAARLSATLQGVVSRMNATRASALAASQALEAGAVSSATGGLLGATDVVSENEYINRLGATKAAIDTLTAAYEAGAIDIDQYNYRVAALSEANQDWVSGLRDASKALDGLGTSASGAVDELSGLIDAQITPSFSLSELAPELAATEGNVDEHYRRLAAIALRGGEEIAAHAQDWQDTIALIPPDVQTQGIGAMQEWAKAQVQAYDAGLDFSLIDKDAIENRILKQLQANEARDAIIAEIAASLEGVSLADVQAAAGDAGLGSGLSASVSVGLKDSIDVEAMLKTTAAAITTGAKTYAEVLKASGGAVGGQILGGIVGAVTDGAGDIIGSLANAIAPSVADILERNARRSGGTP